MPGIDLYAHMCGTEVWNRERTSAYVEHGVRPQGVQFKAPGCSWTPELIACLEDRPPEPQGYQLPELDPAPWYDPTVPESWNFAGLIVLEAELSPALDRRLVQGVGHGAVLTRPRFAGRTLDVRGVLVGKTCCAAEYGLRWLTQALLGDACSGCDGCDITFLTCCPASQGEDDCLVLYEGDTPVPYYRAAPGGTQEWERGADFARYMCGAGLLSGPEVVSRRGASCGCSCSSLTEVEFTIGLGNPWLSRPETTLVDAADIGGCSDFGCAITFVKGCTGGPCASPEDCSDDPDCAGFTAKPPRGMLPTRECGCFPLTAKHTCFTIPADRDWFEQVLIVELYAGSGPLRNVALRTFQNPIGYSCCDGDDQSPYLDDCDACSTLFVDYVPPYGTLVFDSVHRSVTVTCANVTRPAAKNLSALDGMPFRWIELGCQQACMVVDVDCANVADDASITIKAAGREL
jgi:hypothetical protein